MKFWLSSEDQSKMAGAALAADLLPLAVSGPVIVFVRGNLGAGKSTFVRGFLSQAGVTGVMPSPTYSLVEPYQSGELNVFHMDAYRIADGAELDYLGLDDIDRPGTILLVEWPDHVRDELPEPTAIVDLEMSFRPDRHTGAVHSPDLDRSPDPRSPGLDRHTAQSPGLDRHTAQDHSEDSSPNRHHHSLDRHLSDESLDPAGLDSHSVRASDKSSDPTRHLDRHIEGPDAKDPTNRSDSSQMGRLLTLTSGVVPVQEGRLGRSQGWRDLVRVVT